MKQSIVKAQKRIYSIKGELSDLSSRLDTSVSTIAGNDFKEDYNYIANTITLLKEQLIKLKTAVMEANIKHGMFSKILEVGEYKSWITILKNLTINNGVEVNRWGTGGSISYCSQLSEVERQNLITKYKDMVESLTDELDEFNATTYIDVE